MAKQEHKEPPLIVIVGETASGKSNLAHQLAMKYGGEILAADSRSIYRGMDIGTAKPTAKERSEVIYHGIDLVEPGENYSAGSYKDYAQNVIAGIRARRNLPLLVGGTGLYVDGVLFNYSFSEKADPKLRRLLNNKTIPELIEYATRNDIVLDEIMLTNRRHIIRQIERGPPPRQSRNKPYNSLIVGIKPPRSVIRHNITSRVEYMFKVGLRHEVDELVHKYGWDSEALTGIGYKEFKPFYDGQESMSRVKQSIIQNSLRYAKRQRTWFKRNPYIEWFENSQLAADRIDDFLRTHGYTKA